MQNLAKVLLLTCMWSLLARQEILIAQSKEEINRCLEFAGRFDLIVPKGTKFGQIDAIQEAMILADIDRGWIVREDSEGVAILNDRFLHRVYSKKRPDKKIWFEFNERPLEPVDSRDKFSESYRTRAETDSIPYDYKRYPLPCSESTRMFYILMQCQIDPEAWKDWRASTEPIDFKKAELNGYLTAVRSRKGAGWEEHVKVVLANHLFNLAFQKVTDTEEYSVDECLIFFNSLLVAIENDDLVANVEFLRDAIKDLERWKAETKAIAVRKRILDDPTDAILLKLMSVGNAPSIDQWGRIDLDSEIKAIIQPWRHEIVNARILLRDCEIPSRCVCFRSPPTYGPKIIPVRDLVFNFGRE